MGTGATTLGVYKCIAGTTTQIGSNYTQTYVTGDILKLEVAGQDDSAVLTPYINGVAKATRAGVSGLNSGYAGIRISAATGTLDDWEGGDVGAPPAGLPIPVAMHHYQFNMDR